jgi:predicted dehydrogenase
MDNWRTLKGYGFKGFTSVKSPQDKGQFNQFQALVNQQKNGRESIIPFSEIVNTTRAFFAAIESSKEGKWISIK